jgi:hypothetical protein
MNIMVYFLIVLEILVIGLCYFYATDKIKPKKSDIIFYLVMIAISLFNDLLRAFK